MRSDEVVIAEAGAMMYKDASIEMDTAMSTSGKDEGFFWKGENIIQRFSPIRLMLNGEVLSKIMIRNIET